MGRAKGGRWIFSLHVCLPLCRAAATEARTRCNVGKGNLSHFILQLFSCAGIEATAINDGRHGNRSGDVRGELTHRVARGVTGWAHAPLWGEARQRPRSRGACRDRRLSSNVAGPRPGASVGVMRLGVSTSCHCAWAGPNSQTPKPPSAPRRHKWRQGKDSDHHRYVLVAKESYDTAKIFCVP